MKIHGPLYLASGNVITPSAVALTIDSGTTGAINLGTSSNAKVITIGSSSVATSVTVLANGSLNLNGSSGTGTISIGTHSLSGNILIGSTSSSNNTTISGGASLTLQAGNTGPITIGSVTGQGTITLGQYNGTSTINVGNASVSAGTQTINIGSGSHITGSSAITIGSTANASSLILNAGTGNIFSTSPAVALNPFGVAAGGTQELRFLELAANGTSYVAFKAPDSLTSNLTYVLPTTIPTAGQILSSSGVVANVATLSWTSTGASGWAVGGNSTAGTGTFGTNDNSVLSIRIVNGTPTTAGAYLEIQGALGGSSSGDSGDMNIHTAAVSTSANVGELRIYGGSSTSGSAGNVRLSGGSSTSGTNGVVYVTSENSALSGVLRFMEAQTNGTDYVELASPASVTTSTRYILPDTQPTVGQVLSASAPASNIVTLSWIDQVSAGSGITTLNTLTNTTQVFATGTSGTDFAISSATSTHTFNLPDASATARGVITTGAQTIAGAKTFTSQPSFPLTTGAILLGNGGSVSAELGIGTNGQILTSNGTTASWVTPAAGGATIYTGDGTLSGNRVVSTGLNTLSFYGGGSNGIIFDATNSRMYGVGGQIVIAGSPTVTTKLTLVEGASGSPGTLTFTPGEDAQAYFALGGTASFQTELRFYEATANGTNYVGFRAANAFITNTIYELPMTQPSAGQVLTASTVSSGVSQLSWTTPSTGGNPALTIISGATYGASTIDEFIIVNTGTCAVTLPSVGVTAGKKFTVKKKATVGTVTVDAGGSVTIDGDTSNTDIASPYQSLSFVFDGTNYLVY
jgi:hypothetical protein